MIVNHALHQPNVTHVDVIEIDPDVMDLVAPHYLELASSLDKTIHIQEGDVFKCKWPSGTRWDVAWFDIWPHISEDDLPAMTRLRRSYGQRADWCGCWGQDLIR